MVACLVLAGQSRAVNRTGIVVKADERIELRRAGGGIADGAGHVAGITLKIAREAPVALVPRPDSARPDPRSRLKTRTGGAPANRPGFCTRARVWIRFDQAIAALARAAFETLDQGNSDRRDCLRTPTGWNTWNTVLGAKNASVNPLFCFCPPMWTNCEVGGGCMGLRSNE